MRTASTAIAAGIATALAATIATIATVSVSPAPAAAAHTASAVTRSAHIAFQNCNAQHIVLSVTVPGHGFTPTEPVTFTVRLRNTGSTTCGAPLALHVPQARESLTVGPCGTLPLMVTTTAGREVYPGPLAYFCPAQAGFRLGPDTTATAAGNWNQTAVVSGGPGSSGSGSWATSGSTAHAPPGHYRLVVDGAVSVPVTLVPG